jgi:nucleotide-binding universal stress UspA family protein
VIVLVAGADDEQIVRLTQVTTSLFPTADPVAMRVDDASVDVELAWGTRLPAVEAVDPAGVEFGEDLGAGLGAVELPLPVVGDSSLAVAEAVLQVGADLVVVAADDRGWFSRLFSGSATGDLVRQPPVPVLVVPGHATG